MPTAYRIERPAQTRNAAIIVNADTGRVIKNPPKNSILITRIAGYKLYTRNFDSLSYYSIADPNGSIRNIRMPLDMTYPMGDGRVVLKLWKSLPDNHPYKIIKIGNFWEFKSNCKKRNGKWVRKAQKKSISGYHSNTTPIFKGEKANRFIGMEIEKTDKPGDQFDEVPLIQRYETDSSCGYEYITYTYALGQRYFDPFQQDAQDSKSILDLDINDRCGGHTHISRKDMNGRTLLEMVKDTGALAFAFAIFRDRLNQHYASFSPNFAGNSKSIAVKIWTNRLEFRVGPAFKNAEDVILRFQLFNQISSKKFSFKKALKLAEDSKIYSDNYLELTERFYQDFNRLMKGKSPSKLLRSFLKYYRSRY